MAVFDILYIDISGYVSDPDGHALSISSATYTISGITYSIPHGIFSFVSDLTIQVSSNDVSDAGTYTIT